MTTATCPNSISGDHAWPAELHQDAQCFDCGLWYAEYCERLGEVFDQTDRAPTNQDERLRNEALQTIRAALDVTPANWPAHRIIRRIGRQVAGLRGDQLVEWAELVRAQQRRARKTAEPAGAEDADDPATWPDEYGAGWRDARTAEWGAS